jgi:mevalonate kinase
MLFKASAPGSLMLMGEYAVLHGKHALVCAVDKRMTVTLAPRLDKKITISSALGEMVTDISLLNIEPPFQFVLATLKKFQKKMFTGCDITIASEFSDKIGFASSAAVTTALLAALAAWLNVSLTKIDMVRIARTIVRQVQGLGSGADVAACVFGGIVAYRAQPLSIEKLPYHYPLTVIYSGSKTPTVEAIAHVNHFFATQPQLFKQICQLLNACSLQGKKAILNQDWSELGKIMNIQQGLMEALNVSTPKLNQIID